MNTDLNLVDYTYPTLYKQTIPFDFNNPPTDAADLVKQLRETLLRVGGLGLSANQVGLSYAAFVFGNPGDTDSIRPMFNPKIVHLSDKTIGMFEGCLSVPGLVLRIDRPVECRVRFADATGKVATEQFTGLSARIVQHEMCHMNGVPFFAGASKLKLERAIKQAQTKARKVYRYSDLYKLMNA